MQLFEIYRKHINAPCGQNVEMIKVRPLGCKWLSVSVTSTRGCQHGKELTLSTVSLKIRLCDF
jgi:hypothetical protein